MAQTCVISSCLVDNSESISPMRLSVAFLNQVGEFLLLVLAHIAVFLRFF